MGTAKWLNENNWSQQISANQQVIQIAPSAPDSERQILSAVLSSGALGKGRETFTKLNHLKPQDFFLRQHGFVYRAMLRLFERGSEIDATLVVNELKLAVNKDQTALEQVGGEEFIYQIAAISPANLESHIQAVCKASYQRSLIKFGQDVINIGSQNRLELSEMVERSASAFHSVTSQMGNLTGGDEAVLYDALSAEVERLNSDEPPPARISSGFGGLNTIIDGGFRRNSLYLFAAPSGWGKSALLASLAVNILRAGQRVLFFSWEMDIQRVLWRMMTIVAGVEWQRIEKKTLTPDETKRVHNAISELQGLQASKLFTIIRQNHPTPQQIRSKLEEHRFQSGFDAVIMDYVDRRTIGMPSNNSRYSNEEKQASDVWEAIRGMKDTYDAAFITATQINREGSRRQGNYTGEHIFGSSAAKNASDFVGLIKHPARYDDTWDSEACMFIEIDKYRDGSSTDNKGNPLKVYMQWEPQYTRFSDWRQPVPGGLEL